MLYQRKNLLKETNLCLSQRHNSSREMSLTKVWNNSIVRHCLQYYLLKHINNTDNVSVFLVLIHLRFENNF